MDEVFRYYMEKYNDMFENITNYYKVSTKMFEKIVGTHNQQFGFNTDTENGYFPANGHEIYNYVARYGVSNLQIQAILKFDGRLDFDKLNRAVRLSVDAEPDFKSRFIETDPPHWKPLENIGIVNFCSLQVVDDIDSAVQNFVESSVNLDKDPMLNVKLLRSDQYDVLALKVNHTCCDGAGVKEYIQLLAEIYCAIDMEDGTYIPTPRFGGRKDQNILFEHLGVTNMNSLFTPGLDIFKPLWPFPWEPCGSNITCMSTRKSPVGFLDELNEYAKNIGATVNDLILTACYRAMTEMKQPIYGIPMEIPLTVDLRRYLPEHKTQAIRNFSGSVGTKLEMIINEPFKETCRRVMDMMKEIKKGYPGLQSAIGLERIERTSFKEILSYYQAVMETKKTDSFCPLYCGDRCVPTLSNVGYVSKAIIRFGGVSVKDSYILPPVVRAPGLLLMASSYNSVLSLSTGFFMSTVKREKVDRLLNKIMEELIEGAKN